MPSFGVRWRGRMHGPAEPLVLRATLARRGLDDAIASFAMAYGRPGRLPIMRAGKAMAPKRRPT